MEHPQTDLKAVADGFLSSLTLTSIMKGIWLCLSFFLEYLNFFVFYLFLNFLSFRKMYCNVLKNVELKLITRNPMHTKTEINQPLFLTKQTTWRSDQVRRVESKIDPANNWIVDEFSPIFQTALLSTLRNSGHKLFWAALNNTSNADISFSLRVLPAIKFRIVLKCKAS